MSECFERECPSGQMKFGHTHQGVTVSVIIPTFNRSWGLRRAVESVLRQTFSDFELVVVDDASSDDTANVVQQFANSDGRVSYTRQPTNVGVAQNWGTGVAQARGKMISLLMDDDRYAPTFLARRVAALKQHPDALFAFSGYQRVGPSDEPLGQSHPPLRPGQLLNGPLLLRAVLAKWPFVGTCIYRTDAVKRVWPQAESSGLVVDFAVNLFLATQLGASAVFVGGSDFLMADHPEQLSHTRAPEVFDRASAVLEGVLPGSPLWVRRMVRRELAEWLTVWGGRERTAGRRWSSARRLFHAARHDPFDPRRWLRFLSQVAGV